MTLQSTKSQTDFARKEISVRALANWILDYADRLGESVSNMSLNKLIYFTYEEILKTENSILTNAKIEAWQHGPVFREVYHSFKAHDDRPIKSRAKFFDISSERATVVKYHFDEEFQSFLEAFLKPLIPLTASRLRAMSHEVGGAWHSVWMHDGHANPGMEITAEIVRGAQLRKEAYSEVR
jgi:uncharacterized phage-associated protein